MKEAYNLWCLLSLAALLCFSIFQPSLQQTLSPLPSYDSSGTFTIPPGNYYLNSNYTFATNASSNLVITASCNATFPPPCASIDTNGFVFNINALVANPFPIDISNIEFKQEMTTSQNVGTLVFNLDSSKFNTFPTLNLQNIAVFNTSVPFIYGPILYSLNIDTATFQNNTAAFFISLIPPTFTATMNSLSLNHVSAEFNFPTNLNDQLNTSNASFMTLGMTTIISAVISNSNFSANSNLFSVVQPMNLFGYGMLSLSISNCNFEGIPPEFEQSMQTSSTVNPLFVHQPSSVGTATISNNRFSNFEVDIFQFTSFYELYMQSNVFQSCNGNILNGKLSLMGYLSSNQYLGSSAGFSLQYDSSLSSLNDFINNISFVGETFDYQSIDSSFLSSLGPVGLPGSQVVLQYFNNIFINQCSWANLLPSSTATALNSLAILSFQYITSNITITNSNFTDISLTTLSNQPAARILVNIPDTSNANLTMSGNLFGSYDPNDNSTTDILAFSLPGPGARGHVTVSQPQGVSKNSAMVIPRIGSHGTLNLNVIVQTDIFLTVQTVSQAYINVNTPLNITAPLVVAGKIILSFNSRFTFFYIDQPTPTQTQNGTILLVNINGQSPSLNCSQGGSIGLDLGSGLIVPMGSEYELISKGSVGLPSPATIYASSDGNTHSPGFFASFGTASDGSVVAIATPTCTFSCIVGSCLLREECICQSGWSGPTCSCLDTGRPAGVSCSGSNTSIEWVSYTPQVVTSTSTFTLPSNLSMTVYADMSVAGNLVIPSDSKLVIIGAFDVSGMVSLTSSAALYPASCDIFLPALIEASVITSSSSANFQIQVANNLPSACTSKRGADDFFHQNADSLMVSNSTLDLNGQFTIDASSIPVPNGKQQLLKIVTAQDASGSNNAQVSTKTGNNVCPTSNVKPELITVFMATCAPKSGGIPWWYWGIAVIAAGTIVILVVILVLAVPSCRKSVRPFAGSSGK